MNKGANRHLTGSVHLTGDSKLFRRYIFSMVFSRENMFLQIKHNFQKQIIGIRVLIKLLTLSSVD